MFFIPFIIDNNLLKKHLPADPTAHAQKQDFEIMISKYNGRFYQWQGIYTIDSLSQRGWKIPNHNVTLLMNNKTLEQKDHVKYLGFL